MISRGAEASLSPEISGTPASRDDLRGSTSTMVPVKLPRLHHRPIHGPSSSKRNGPETPGLIVRDAAMGKV